MNTLSKDDFTSEVGYVLYCNRHRLPMGFDRDPDYEWKLDNKQWEAVLRSLSGIRAYRWLNAGRMEARGITDFLLLDRRFPRSLRFCVDKLESNLRFLAEEYGEEGRSHELVREAANELRATNVDEIIEVGLHQFISATTSRAAQISAAIAEDYRFVD